MKEKDFISNSRFNKDNEIFLEMEEDNNNLISVPLTNPSGGPTMFVNSKQYLAIQRRRIKKMNMMKKMNFCGIKRKKKYEKRSLHAKNRIRTKDGKFHYKTPEIGVNEISTKDEVEIGHSKK